MQDSLFARQVTTSRMRPELAMKEWLERGIGMTRDSRILEQLPAG
jgi:hypothetical protein